MATFIKDQFPFISAANSATSDDDDEAGTPLAKTPIAEKKESIVKTKETAEYKGIDQHVHITLRQMYHIFDYFTQESHFGKQVKDIRKELDEAKRQSVFTNLNHDALKEKCAEAF